MSVQKVIFKSLNYVSIIFKRLPCFLFINIFQVMSEAEQSPVHREPQNGGEEVATAEENNTSATASPVASAKDKKSN